jgi:hypothetical protein
MSSEEIIHYFRQLLLERGRASLPGLGSLVFNRTPASISENFSKILPPKYQLDWTPFGETNPSLVDFILLSNDVKDKASIKKDIEHVAAKIKEYIHEKGSYPLPGIGSFTHNGDFFDFKSEENVVSRNSLGFPVIDAIPLTGRYGKNAENIVEPLSTQTIVTDKTIETKVHKKSDADFNFKNILPLLILGLLIAGLVYYLEKLQHTSGDTLVENEVIIHENEQAEPKSDTVATVTPDPNKATLNPDGSYTGKCIIITGSFVDVKNVEKMSNDLAVKGYTIYTESIGEKTRVGFSFECDGVNLAEYIHKIRKELTAEAWYLQPAITVE